MPLPPLLTRSLRVPVIGAPMFLVSFPPLVLALCKAGVVGSFPHVNARPSSQLDDWLTEFRRALSDFAEDNPGKIVAPFAVNLVVHRTYTPSKPILKSSSSTRFRSCSPRSATPAL